ncbi:hypothetical protein I79_013687 [Cricetulus griseus]|uniref:Uncharacterized protein n=1 Tax=Cricetulus griseus TaxID=10029 RepID=G3HS61_CRIGR|nr:hypothetical protein I79_013687 [Cricetulus griseus]
MSYTFSEHTSLLVFCLSTSWCGFSYRKVRWFCYKVSLATSIWLSDVNLDQSRPAQEVQLAVLALPLGNGFTGPTCRRASAYKFKYQSRILIQGQF